IHDMERTLEMSKGFNLKTWVIINKFDINIEMANKIEDYCKTLDIELLAKIPFNTEIVKAMVNCKTIPEHLKDSEIHIDLLNALNRLKNYAQ
ncbi:MAG: hypothetical protein PHE33_05710, partial [Bacteroidales bacterium]|nr:hypothetical protein [Bacteroidales bacterium]